MGKRSNFKRRKNDAYDTPAKAVLPLIPFLQKNCRYVEPTAGCGMLVEALREQDQVFNTAAYDIKPRAEWIRKLNALDLKESHVRGADFIITNPPWTRQLLHPMIDRFRALRPTWLLFDSDWAYTKQARPYLKYCSAIVAVGRVKWIKKSKHQGMDNCSWYLFHATKRKTIFYPKMD